MSSAPEPRADPMAALADVYTTLLELRRGAPKPPPATFRALAAELPGALRILDRMPEDELARRAVELRSPTSPRAFWIDATLAWREEMRAALAVRRAAGRDRDLARARAELASPGLEEHHLEGIVRPPSGRLVRWALGQAAARLGRSPAEIEDAVFGGHGASSLDRAR